MDIAVYEFLYNLKHHWQVNDFLVKLYQECKKVKNETQIFEPVPTHVLLGKQLY